MSKYGTCGVKIDGVTITLNDKKELTANVDKSAQIEITDGDGVVAGLITIEAEGGNPSIHFSGTDTATPIILSGIDTPSFNNDSANKKYVDDEVGAKPGKVIKTGNSVGEIFNDLENNTATGSYSHAEGLRTKATDSYAHAEGSYTNASAESSYAEGSATSASGQNSHAEGSGTVASGTYAHAEGSYCEAQKDATHAEGYNTIAASDYQHVQGKYNIEDADKKYAHIVGNGTFSTRSNAHTLDWNGNAWFAGDVTNTAGKGLSKNDYTDEDKTKLEGIIELPSVTADDNGKILKVVDGVWAAVATE